MTTRILIIGLLIALSGGTSAWGQSWKKELAKAKKNLTVYELDKSKTDKLIEARIAIDNAYSAMTEDSKNYDITYLSGKIYFEIANAIDKANEPGSPNVNNLLTIKNSALVSATSLLRAINHAEKKYEFKDIEDVLLGTRILLHNSATTSFEYKDYKQAYKKFNMILTIYSTLQKEEFGDPSWLPNEELDHQFMAGASAFYANDYEKSKIHFEFLLDKEYNEIIVFSSLFTIYKIEDPAKAESILNKGRDLNPDDLTLLYLQINMLLEAARSEELLALIDEAIRKDQSNASLYLVKGNVYEQMYNSELATGNEEQAHTYFDLAFQTYTKGIEKQANFDLLYNTGALFYNRGAYITSQMEGLDFSTSEEDRAKEAEMQNEFRLMMRKALGYFIVAEQIDSSNVDLLNIIKTVYLYLENYDQVTEYDRKINEARGQ